MSMVGGVMKMRELKDGLPIPAHGTVTLAPNGYHIMFTGLKQPLAKGSVRQGDADVRTRGRDPGRVPCAGSRRVGRRPAEEERHGRNEDVTAQSDAGGASI